MTLDNGSTHVDREGDDQTDGGNRVVFKVDPTTGLITCAWADPYFLTIPTTWISGIYVAKLSALELSQKQNYVIFVVRNDDRVAHYLFQSSVTTFQAYNEWPYRQGGGQLARSPSLYSSDILSHHANLCEPGNTIPGATQVSFDRPYGTYDAGDPTAPRAAHNHSAILSPQAGGGDLFYWEINMLRWLERNGYDVKYCTSLDADESPIFFRSDYIHAILSVGHDEYWSTQMRRTVEGARDQGVNLAFFSANVCMWRIHFDSTRRIFTCDKAQDAWAAAHEPEDVLVGMHFVVDTRILSKDMIISAPKSWLFIGASFAAGSSPAVLRGIVGYEADAIIEPPPSSVRVLACSPLGRGPCGEELPTSHMTVYAAASGAQVFAAGTIQWSWGLDEWNEPTGRPEIHSQTREDVRVITANILRRFSALPSRMKSSHGRFQGWFLDYNGDAVVEDLGVSRVIRGLFLTKQAGPLWQIVLQADGSYTIQLASGRFQDWYLDFDNVNGEVVLCEDLMSGAFWAITQTDIGENIEATTGDYRGWFLDADDRVVPEEMGIYTIARAIRLSNRSAWVPA